MGYQIDLKLRVSGFGSQYEELFVMAVPIEMDIYASYNWRMKEEYNEVLETDSVFLKDMEESGLKHLVKS